MYAYKTGSTTERNAGQPSFNIMSRATTRRDKSRLVIQNVFLSLRKEAAWFESEFGQSVGMNKCVFRTEGCTFDLKKWTFLLTREDKIKKGLQGWNYRQGELQERLRGTQYEACPQMTGETSLGAQESSERKRWLPCPQTKTVPNTRNQGNWRQEARILRSDYPSSTLRAVVSPRRT